MTGIIEKIGRKKIVVAILLVSIVAFSVGYALFQTRTGFAILTTPPPGIPGPYYVTAEAKIYGPAVDLAMIKSRTGGTYAADYTYVQFGGSQRFYRVYKGNTLQEVCSGQILYVMQLFCLGFSIENDLKDTFDDLKNEGALDLTSTLGGINYFGNMPGTFISIYRPSGSYWSGNLTTRNSYWYATYARSIHSNGWVEVKLNDTRCLYMVGLKDGINATGSSANLYYWNVTGTAGSAVAFYFEDLQHIETTISEEQIRVYTVVDSPGTSFVSKCTSPSSPVVGSGISVTVKFDPPSAEKMNVTDAYPDTFTWGSVDVILEKFKAGVGLEETAYVHVIPTPDGSNMMFTIDYNEALDVLESLTSDEYVYLTYSLLVPEAPGEYTLPPATMSYMIPMP